MEKPDEQLIHETHLFDNLDQVRFEKILSTISEVKYSAGTIFIKQGDLADSLYLLKEGVIQVYTYNDAGEEIIHARLEKGDYVGEQALLTTTPGIRNANVRAVIDIVLLKLDHAAFREVMEFDPVLRKKLEKLGHQHLLARLVRSGLIYDLSNYLTPIADDYEIKRFNAQEVILREGDVSDGTYYLLSGQVDIIKKNLEGIDQLIRSIPTGNFFGEFGVIKNLPRTASAIAKGPVVTIYISAEKYRDLYNTVPEIKLLVDANTRVYESPARGQVTQFFGDFMGMPATISRFKLKNGEEITASWIVEKNIFALTTLKAENGQHIRYETATCSRELLVKDSKLVGVLSFGEWEHLSDVYLRVLDDIPITDQEIVNFKECGDLTPSKILKEKKEGGDEQIICGCMYISKGEIVACIRGGAASTKEISAATGAGTVCGSCVPKIHALLGHSRWRSMRILEIKGLTDSIRSYKLVGLTNDPLNDFIPGQHVVIQLEIDGKLIERSYTLTSAPGEPTYYEIAVKREEKGYFSKWLFQHDKTLPMIRVSSPLGMYKLNMESTVPVVCFVAGVGVTPAISFARTIAKLKINRTLYIHYSVRTEKEMVYESELNELSGNYPAIKLFKHFTKEKGRIQSNDVANIVRQMPEALFFICGPLEYQKMIESVLQSEGIEKNRIFTEQFTPAAAKN